jgi:septum site-determining protein MinC
VQAVAQSIEFKGTTLPVIAVALPCLDPADLAELARTRFGDSDFFDGDAALLDLGQLEDSLTADWPALRRVFAAHGLVVIGVRGGPAELQADARAAGLLVTPPERPRRPGAREPEAMAPTAEPRDEPPTTDDGPIAETADITVEQPVTSPAPEETASATEPTESSEPIDAPVAPLIMAPPARPSMIVDRPLRSGQQVYARNADLIVMAVVSHGAEVIADGSIHVYAPLRGRALAGAAGDTGARIFTTRFEAELVSVAGVYRTFEGGVPEEFASHPTQVRLVGEGEVQKLSISPLSTT